MVNEKLLDGPPENSAPFPPQPSPLPCPDAPALSAPLVPTPSPASPSTVPRRSVGKIARLPLPIRNLVCDALRQGRRYREIIGLLDAQGFPGITEHNISRWARGGYRHWLLLQERFDISRPLSDRLQALLGQVQPDNHSTLSAINESILLAYFHELLLAFDAPGLPEKSDDFLRLSKAFSAYLGARAQGQRAELDRLSYQLELRKLQKNTDKPGGLTLETIRLLEEKGKML